MGSKVPFFGISLESAHNSPKKKEKGKEKSI